MENTISEVLFDMAQQKKNLSFFSCESNQEVILKSPPISTSAIFKQKQDAWQQWLGAGFGDIYPYLSAVLQKPEQLQHEVSPLVYKNFERLINRLILSLKEILW